MSVRQLKHQRQLQIAGLEQLLVAQHVLHCAIGCQPALMQEQHAVAGFINKIKVMRRNQLRTRQAAQNIYQITPILRIERRRQSSHKTPYSRYSHPAPAGRRQQTISIESAAHLSSSERRRKAPRPLPAAGRHRDVPKSLSPESY